MPKLTSKSIARLGVAFVFFYHGLVPKLLCVHPSEVELAEATPTFGIDPVLVVRAAGLLEVLLALTVLMLWHKRWPVYVAGITLVALLLATIVFAPSIMVAAFNPVSLTVVTLALVWIALTPDEEASKMPDTRAAP